MKNPSSVSPEDKQHRIRLWTERLYQDYDHILYAYNIRMGKPVIQVVDLDSIWGRWHAMTRTISLSVKLIDMHSWDVVLEILKHEMAHQMVHEIYGYREQHGAHFRRACDALGVAAWAQTASGEIPKDLLAGRDRQLPPEEARLLQRIEKLLALAESTNEHEAALAMEKVRHIYTKYNLERLAAQRTSTMVHCVITRKKKRTESFESLIFSILNEHFYVRSIHTTLFDAKNCAEYKAVEILGTQENVQIAEYVYHFLWNTLQDLWRTYQQTSQRRDARARRSYMLGVLSGFRTKLCNQTAEGLVYANRTRRDATALMAVGNAELAQFVGYRYPKLSTRSWSAGSAESAVFEAGRTEGASLNLRRGLHHQAGNQGKRLT